jgi:hypothetical protein
MLDPPLSISLEPMLVQHYPGPRCHSPGRLLDGNFGVEHGSPGFMGLSWEVVAE